MKKILLICTALCAIGIGACINNRNNNFTNITVESLNKKAKITGSAEKLWGL